MGLYRDNAQENGNYYKGFYRDNGKENGNYYNGLYRVSGFGILGFQGFTVLGVSVVVGLGFMDGDHLGFLGEGLGFRG